MLNAIAFLYLSLSHAFAVPVQLQQQGRLLDNNGAAVNGSHVMTFRLYDAQFGGSPLWEESPQVLFTDGYYTATLGDSSSNPLDDGILNNQSLYLEVEIDGGGPIGVRKQVVSTPYSRRAGKAESIDGGSVNASEVSIDGQLVIDGNGDWVGPTTTVNWTDIQGIPADIADGDADTLSGVTCNAGEILGWNGNAWACAQDNGLTEAEVETFITNGPLDLAAGTTVDGQPLLTQGDGDTLSDLSCLNGDVAKWDIALGLWVCDLDTDSLGELNCNPGDVAEWNGSAWGCGVNDDNTVPVAQQEPCDSSNQGLMYFDLSLNALMICDGVIYQELRVCDTACPLDSTVACGDDVENDCGDNCGSTGTGFNTLQCDNSSLVECGDAITDDCGNDCGYLGDALKLSECDLAGNVSCGLSIYDSCGNDCGYQGEGFDTAQCDAAATTCGDPVEDNCGNGCGTTGEYCADPNATCNAGTCSVILSCPNGIEFQGGCIWASSGSHSFTVPSGITSLQLTMIGGGGNGASGYYYVGGSGGSGYYVIEQLVSVTPGDTISIQVGSQGQSSSFGATTVSPGGNGSSHSNPGPQSSAVGGNGGNGGGAGYTNASNTGGSGSGVPMGVYAGAGGEPSPGMGQNGFTGEGFGAGGGGDAGQSGYSNTCGGKGGSNGGDGEDVGPCGGGGGGGGGLIIPGFSGNPQSLQVTSGHAGVVYIKP